MNIIGSLVGLHKLSKCENVSDTNKARKATTNTSMMVARTCGVVPTARTH